VIDGMVWVLSNTRLVHTYYIQARHYEHELGCASSNWGLAGGTLN
jgi:hypothetical protein